MRRYFHDVGAGPDTPAHNLAETRQARRATEVME